MGKLKQLMPLTPDVKVQAFQKEQLATMSFLHGLPKEYETLRSQILSSDIVASLPEVYSRVLRAKVDSPSAPIALASALASRGSWDNKDNRGPPTWNSSKP